MYDRQTQSLWSQILSQAVTGPMKGTLLPAVALRIPLGLTGGIAIRIRWFWIRILVLTAITRQIPMMDMKEKAA